ncbi:MAG: nucleoside-diphosphate-sugar epimerase [Verrucomicrobiales bacterium]|jgi:nucleoside-diphosphate-sugar epimerase
MERILITGATGCIGSAACAWLRANGFSDLVAFTRTGEAEGMEAIAGDIANRDQIEAAVAKVRPARIIHLAAFQSPDCQSQPFRGMEINVEGTNHLFRAAAGLGSDLKRFVFASSSAVYGPRSLYPGATVCEDGGLQPPNLYGYWKVAGEGAAQAFHAETGVATVSLRLATTYGPGRDRGLTSAPTSAMKSVAHGESFAMPYHGREHYHFVEDVGAAFAISATAEFSGYDVFNLRGQTRATTDFLDLVSGQAAGIGLPTAQLSTAEGAPESFFVCDLDDAKIVERFPEMPLTPLDEGIEKSLRFFAA